MKPVLHITTNTGAIHCPRYTEETRFVAGFMLPLLLVE
jgi:hypothetical protein